jgi:uncharacterized protein
MGPTSQTAEASEAHFCVPPLRNGALGSSAYRADLTRTVTPIGAGSVIGAGGLFVGVVAASVLKFVLGVILIVSAVRIFYS